MKKVYAFLVVLLFGFGVGVSYAQPSSYYYSETGTYDYSEVSAWDGSQPPADGDLGDMIWIPSGSIITKTDTGSGDDIIAGGSYYTYSGYIYGTFVIEGNLDVTGGTFYIGNGGTVIVYGDLEASETVYVGDGGTLIVYGNVNVTGELWVNTAGTVVVQGDLTTSQLSGGDINYLYGDVVVGGNATLYSVASTGTTDIIIGGDLYYDQDFTINGDIYLLDDDAIVDGDSDFLNAIANDPSIISGEDDLEDDSDADNLIDLINDYQIGDDGSVEYTEDPVSAAGEYTFVVPDGVYTITVECWGAGGAGGGSTSDRSGGSGGGGGAYVMGDLTVNPGDTITYTVGAAGVGSLGADGSAGGDTEFLTLIAGGGKGGAANKGAAGSGGIASGGTINTPGTDGSIGSESGGAGGAGANGGEGGFGSVSNSDGNDGTGPGGGGSGGEASKDRKNTTSYSGGAGADGQVSISYMVPVTYYSIASGDLNDLANWSTIIDGTGNTPINFTTDNQSFEIQKGHTMSVSGDLDLSTYRLELDAGAQLTVSGNLITGNQLIINNTPDDPTSIIVYGVVTGDAIVNWSDITAGEYQLMGHAISDISIDDYNNSFTGGYKLYYYNNGWVTVNDDSDFDENPMQAYDYKFTAEGEVFSYEGELNNEEMYTYTADVRSWHLVANPYPSYVNIEEEGFDFGGFEKTIYIRQGDNKVTTYDYSDPDNPVAVNGGSNILAPNQGVWVWTSTAGSEISIASSAREQQETAVSLKSSSSKSSNILRLSLESDYSSDETVLVFSENGSESSCNYDADKMLAYGSIANFYSLKDGDDLVVNSLPELVGETVIPLGYKVASSGLGEFTLTASDLSDFNEDYTVYLYDLYEDVIINLRDESSYTFTASETQDDDRFEIRLESAAVVTAIDDEVVISDNDILIYSVNLTAVVQVSNDLLMGSNKAIKVYNLAGHLIQEYELNETVTKVELPKAYTVYIIRVEIDSASYQEKVVSMK
jgi:hypothetical protein